MNEHNNSSASTVTQKKTKRMLTWNFISGEMKYFHLGVWSSSYNCLHDTHRNEKFIAGVILLQSFWQKWNFVSGDKISCKHYPKWNYMKGNICTCVNKIGFYLMGHLSRTTLEMKFISFFFSMLNINTFTMDVISKKR